MEIHTPQSLYAMHGLTILSRPRDRWRWTRSFIAFLAQRMAMRRREREIRRAIATLERMDDRLLADIGINRSDIPDAVRRTGAASWLLSRDESC